MAKHAAGKNIRAEIFFNGKSVLVYVIKGNGIKHAPTDNFGDWDGGIHVTLPQSTKSFDFEFNEILNSSCSKDVVLVLCTLDSIFEYAYSRVKSMIA